MKILLLALLLAIATSAPAAPYTAVLADTNGVQVSPAMLTLTNVVIEGFAFEDIADLDISDRSPGDVIAWDGTNHNYVAQGGHDAVTQGEGDIGTLVGQIRAVTTNQVRAAAAGAFVNLSSGGTVTNVDAQIVLTGGSSYLEASSGAFQTGLSVNAYPVLTTASDLDADTFNGNAAPYYLAFSNHTGTVNSAQILDGTVAPDDLSTTARTITIRGDQWTGPLTSEKPGWALKSFDLAGETKLLARGFQDFSGTQYTATADSEFRTPTDATAFRTTAAILVTLLADSTTSSICCYRLYVYKNATQIYDSGATQTVASTSAKHVISIPASSLGTFTAGASYTIRVEASVKYDSAQAKGIYFVGTPTIQVIK